MNTEYRTRNTEVMINKGTQNMNRPAHMRRNATDRRSPGCVHIHHYQLLQSSVFGVQCSVLFPSTHQSDPEDNRYIYHSDHLGSSAFLTDIDGSPTQHLQYLPFGEPFIEQRSVTEYYTPYTFSAKERDLETGYSYFWARYYDATLSIWLSVDPMADVDPRWSPYRAFLKTQLDSLILMGNVNGRSAQHTYSLYTSLNKYYDK